MQYNIGCATFGWPILWEREANSSPWTGARIRLDDVNPDLVNNWNSYQFALELKSSVQVNDWVYVGVSSFVSAGWYQVRRVAEWCVYVSASLRMEDVPLLYILAYAPADKSSMTMRFGELWREDLWWRLHGL